MQAFFETVSQAGFAAVYSDILRYILPLAALLILWRCGRSLLAFRREPEVFFYVNLFSFCRGSRCRTWGR